MKQLLLLATTIGLLACSSAAPENRDPAVARYEIMEGDALEIRGIAADGTTVGALTIKYGHYYSDEFEREADGTMIDFDIHGVQASHRSDGKSRLELPAIGGAEVSAFLTDTRLVDVLDRWQVKMVEVADVQADAIAGGETAYDACPASGLWAPTAQCNASSCAMYPAPTTSFPSEKRQDVCCPGQSLYAHRTCSAAASGGSTCGDTGPGGCKVCWTQSFEIYCDVVDHGGYAEVHIDTYTGNIATELTSWTGGWNGSGGSTNVPVLLVSFQERITFGIQSPAHGDFSIEPFGPYFGGESCSGNVCSSTYNGQWGVTITHNQTGLTHTFNYVQQ